jgi:hypothetical protein
MAWYFGARRIFVQDYSETDTAIVPRLQPLSGPTVYQWFGYERPILNLSGLVVGNTDKVAIKGFYDDGIARTLTGPYSINKDYYVKKCVIKLNPTTCQTIRPDLDTDSPVYNIELELYEAES